ncbi:hypothetical protein CTI12_AA207800 [Artemisia annua]|uniref:RNA-directed DNA polymerase, eukaryota n=1 Tax=Artemisia annua TaxID=35608 RepID=A0A2U1P0G7_ARTAN|nr:hypothetical protein CTI12_AA207800 [Artemisia annua]
MARGRSGGIISMWDPNSFMKDTIWCDDSFIIVKGKWKNFTGDCFMINIYGPQDPSAKANLWNKLADFMQYHNGKFILFGDMNVFRRENERFGSIFSHSEANQFKSFSDNSGLIDLPIGALERLWSDHTPILFNVSKVDFGPSHFKLYNSWLYSDGFDEVVKSTWSSLGNSNNGNMIRSHVKLRSLKTAIKQWYITVKISNRTRKQEVMMEI